MPFRAVTLCKPCLNKKYPLRKQLLLSFLALASVSLLLALAVVIGTTAYIGNKAESEARASLEDQIKRHLTDASVEAADTIGERFRKLQYGVLDVTAFALRDTLQEDFVLDSGGEGYPLTPAHTDLRDTEITASAEANLQSFYRQNIPVDLSRSVWYYADAESPTISVPEDEQAIIVQSARLDLLWPTMYINSNDTKGVFASLPFTTSTKAFRYFPGADLSGVAGSLFACEDVDEEGCFDARKRTWYMASEDALIDTDTQLGDVTIAGPYIDALEAVNEYIVTLARAVYSNKAPNTGNLLGVVGMDVRLEQLQENVESINFLATGYSVLATAGDDGVVLAAPTRVWDRDAADSTTTVCALGNGLCSGAAGGTWEGLLTATKDFNSITFTSEDTSADGEAEESILIVAPVKASFDNVDSGGEGTVTHYILSAVPRDEIFAPVDGMADLIQESTTEIIITTAIVASCTLLAVAAAVYFLSGSITRPIVKMTLAARSIAKDGAKTDVFGSVAAAWGGGGGAGGSATAAGNSDMDSRTAGRYSIDRTRALDYLLCRGDDEISTLAREFSLMITGLGRRGSAAAAKGLVESSAYPRNPFTKEFVRPPPTGPSAPAPVP